jgi:hypothetical protein
MFFVVVARFDLTPKVRRSGENGDGEVDVHGMANILDYEVCPISTGILAGSRSPVGWAADRTVIVGWRSLVRPGVERCGCSLVVGCLRCGHWQRR